MARNLYDVGDSRPSQSGKFLRESSEAQPGSVPWAMLIVALGVGGLAIAAIAFSLSGVEIGAGGNAADPAAPSTFTISDRFSLCDDEDGQACVLSPSTYSWRGKVYHVSDIVTPGIFDAHCPEEADLAARGRHALAGMLNGGDFEARPDAADSDPQARILVRDGVSLGELMVMKGYAKPWTKDAVDWCKP